MKLRRLSLCIICSWLLGSSGLMANSLTVDQLLQRKPEKVADPIPGNMNDRIYKRLAKAQQLMADGKYDSAIELLKGLEESTSKQPYAAAQVYQTFAYTYAQKDDFANAAIYFKKSIDEKALPLAPTLNSMYSLAQVLVAQEKFLDAIPYVQDYIFNREEPRPDAHFFLGQLYAQLERKQAAVTEVEKAIKLAAEPKESWYRLQAALYYELKSFSKAADALQILVRLNPEKKEYWKQLSSIYIAADKDDLALATLEVAYKKDFLDEEKDLLQLIRLSIFRGVPYKAGVYLDQAFAEGKIEKTQKNFELLADAWIQAQELNRALDALSKAAPLAKDGAVYVRQGQLYLEKEDWDNSIKSLKAGISKGGLKKPGIAYVALGIAQFKKGYVQASIESFQEARRYPQQEKQATEWINHLTSMASNSH